MVSNQRSRVLYLVFALIGFLLLCGGIGCLIELRRTGSIALHWPSNQGHSLIGVPAVLTVATDMVCGLGLLASSTYQLIKRRRT